MIKEGLNAIFVGLVIVYVVQLLAYGIIGIAHAVLG
jgi:hypothetical protein